MASPPELQTRTSIEAMEEERELVRRMKEGEERAFEEFAAHYIPGLYRFATNRLPGEPELIRDIVQGTVCKVIEKLDTYRGEAPLFVWLYAFCRNEIAGHFRRASSRPVFADLDESALEAVESTPEAALLQNERDHLVHLALDQLPPRYASALEWKYLGEESVVEIGRRLDLTPKAAESLLTRARRAFELIHARLMEKSR